MKSIVLVFLVSSLTLVSISQVPVQYKAGVDAEDNLNRIVNLTPTGTGGLGFDTRFEGVKGSPMLFEKLIPAFLKISGSDEYLKLNLDIDVYQNRVIFSHPKTGKQLSITSVYVTEIILRQDTSEKVFNTTSKFKFEKESKEIRFLQVLNGPPYQILKMPVKELIEANYKNAYSAGIKYDEFVTGYKYFIMGDDGIFHPLKLNVKALTKLFPAKKSQIESLVTQAGAKSDEELILYLIGRL
jgi:hypothetical protein